jgi:hypothetical protein
MAISKEIRNECVTTVEEYFRIHLGEELESVGYRADDGEWLVIVEAHTTNDHKNYRVEVDSSSFTVIRLFELVRNEQW